MFNQIPMQTMHDTTQPTAPGEEHPAWTVDALHAVWEHQRGRVDVRIRVIERAITMLASDRLDTDFGREAERAAHMLAGSVGMFGFLDASDAAHELEHELAHPIPDRAPALAELLGRVRSGVRGPVALCTDAAA